MENIFDEIQSLFEEFKVEHGKNLDKGNKSAGARARKALGEIKKLVTEYRKQSVAHNSN
tara:strand:- start:1632 stop:1808 length:177 start_codon:yes stop_codon:yes gene_type:complete